MKKDFSVRLISLSEIYNVCSKLADKLLQAEERFDLVIAIARGGFPVGRLICDFLNLHHLYSVQITHYKGGGQKKSSTEITAPVNVDIKNKRVLVVDDVNDSGDTLKEVNHYIQSLGAKSSKLAVLHEKPTTTFKADYVGVYIKDWKWLMYQWAATEDVLSFLSKDQMLNESLASIQSHLVKKYDLKLSQKMISQIISRKDRYIRGALK